MNEPVIAQKGPYEVVLEPGMKSWCTCGESKTQPFCDASHREKGVFRSLKFEIKEKGTYWLCGCKRTSTPPFCDGTHNKI